MSQIPGLSLCPVDDETGEGSIRTQGFTEIVVVPEAHKYGNCRKVSEFKKLEVMQEGKFGSLFKVIDTRNGAIHTLKYFIIDFMEGIPLSISRETAILKSINHMNIIRYYGMATGRRLESNYLILEYCPVSLKDIVDRNIIPIYEESVVKCIIQQLLQGLNVIHSKNAAHRDINFQNLLFTETGVLKISGFSSVRYTGETCGSPPCSVLRYGAPELLLQTEDCGPPVDIWAAGCLFAELILRKPLFKGDSELEVLNSIISVLGTPTETLWLGFNELFAKKYPEEYEILLKNECCHLKIRFADCATSCYDFAKYVFLYFWSARFTAEQCLQCPYFETFPPACSLENIATILESAPAIKREPNVKAWEE